MKPAVEKFARHVNPAFVRLLGMLGYGRVFVRASDVRLWDDEGREYLDLLAGFGAVNVGHNHPRLVRALQESLATEPVNLVHVGPSVPTAELAEVLAALARPLEITLFSNSGAEAVEAGLKLARAATRRDGFVSCRDSFHGTSLGTLSVIDEPRLRAPFEPLLPGCERVPFGDLAALEKALAPRHAAAFLVEPVQAEGGVRFPPPGYLKEAQELCRRAGTLLVLDEVQTGFGRTGTMFAYQAEDFVPDVLVLGKSLGGSLLPVSATLTTAEIHAKSYGSMDRFDLHGSTFGGNSLGCAAALETLRVIADENLVANAAARGKQLLEGLKRRLAGHPLVRDVRGRGLLVGIELGPTDSGWMNRFARPFVEKVSRSIFGQWAALKLLERGLLCQPAVLHWNVLRLEPPLTIREADVDRAIDGVIETLSEYRGVAPLLKDVAARLGRQFARGWEFP
jgi:putrescine aminotransferase